MLKQLALAGLLATTAAAHADFIKVAVNGGYSTIGMKEINDTISKQKDSDTSAGMTVKKNDAFGSAYFVAGEAGIILMPFVEIGPRVEFLGATPLQYLAEGTGTFTSRKYDATLTSAMLGITAGMDLPLTGLGVQVAAYAGQGFAAVNIAYAGTGYAGSDTYSGNGFVAEVQGKLKYSIFPLVSLDLLGGVRLANLGQLKPSGSTNIKESWDFGGINAGGGLTVGF